MGSIILTFFSAAIILIQISCQKGFNAQSTTYTLPAATSSTLGGIIVGNGLTITGNGTLSVSTTTTPTTGGLTQLNKLIFKKVIGSGSSAEIWTANYDGSNATKVNIGLPSGVVFDDNMIPVLSPNGQKIFFAAGVASSGINFSSKGDLYSCNLDGSVVTKIVIAGTNNGIQIGGAY